MLDSNVIDHCEEAIRTSLDLVVSNNQSGFGRSARNPLHRQGDESRGKCSIRRPGDENPILAFGAAASQAATGLKQALSLEEQQQVADEIERRIAERTKELSEANQELRLQAGLLQNLPVSAWTLRPDGTPDFVNKVWLEFSGQTLDFVQSHPEAWMAAVHPEDHERALRIFWDGVNSGQSFAIETRSLRAKDQTYRWHLQQAVPLRDAQGRVLKFVGTTTDIDDQKRAEERLRESELEARLIVDSIPGLVCALSPEGKVELVNRQFLEYFGMTFEEMKGWASDDSIHPDDRLRSVKTLENSIKTGAPHEIEQRCRRADGVYRWFRKRTRAVRDAAGRVAGWYVLLTDIQDQKSAEDELQRKEAFLAKGQHLSSTGTFSWRLDTDEIVFSEEASRIFDFQLETPVTPERICGRIHPDDVLVLSEKVKQARNTGEDQDFEIRLRMANDTVKYVHASSHATRHKDGHLEYIGAVQDVTERRLSGQALGKLRSELAHMARVTSLGAVTASIAHEVNQPLTGIVTNAYTCLRTLSTDPPDIDGAREAARRMVRDGNRACEVIARLRALFSNKEATAENVDLNDAAREVIALCSDDLQSNRVILRQELASDLGSVTGDRIQLQQVIFNLVRNASDAMSGVDDRPRVLVIQTARDDGDCVRLTVQDTGAGITQQDKERLFDAFYTTKREGMGIGLSVSRSIIENHGGRLWATRHDGPGATFSFSVPCRLRVQRLEVAPTNACSNPF
jgi:PAS domain S-box-containing protein